MALACLSLTLKACTNYLLTSSMPSFPSGLSNARVAPAASECFVNVAIPAVLETVPKRVLIRAATIRTEITPARFEPSSERVLVTPANTRLEVVPATYETVTERVVVQPARKQTVVIPATFQTITECAARFTPAWLAPFKLRCSVPALTRGEPTGSSTAPPWTHCVGFNVYEICRLMRCTISTLPRCGHWVCPSVDVFDST